MRKGLLVMIVALSQLIVGCAGSLGRDQAAMKPTETSSAQVEYRIGVDDQLQVSVWRNQDLSVAVPVRPDGMISVPLIGDVPAGGRTPAEVAATIEEKLGRYIREPQVTVIVTELRSHEFISRVRITGAVERPLSLPYRQGMTVLDAVLEAGGLTEFASANRAKLYRRTSNKAEVFDVRLDSILSRGELSTNYYLLPGDIISVPERFF